VFWRMTGTMFSQYNYELAERQVNLAALSLMEWDSTRYPGDVIKNGVVTINVSDVAKRYKHNCRIHYDIINTL